MISSSDYSLKSYDCFNQDYIMNISTNFEQTNTSSEVYHTEKISVQILQEKSAEQVTIHEIKVLRSMIIYQCGWIKALASGWTSSVREALEYKI